MVAGRSGKKKRVMIAAVAAVLLLCTLLLGLMEITVEDVSGNHQYSREQIEQLIFDEAWSKNPLVCYVETMLNRQKTIPFVEGYQIVFKSPTKVEIIVYEKSVVGYVSYMSSYMYFDKDGIIVESTSQQMQGIPQITGLKFGQIVLYQPLPVENQNVFQEILSLTQLLSTQAIEVDKIRFNSKMEMELTIKDLVVKLGTNEQLGGKIIELKNMLTDYQNLSGTLYLDVYDEANTNPMYRFEKR